MAGAFNLGCLSEDAHQRVFELDSNVHVDVLVVKRIVLRFISDAFHMSKRTSYSSVNKLAVDALIKNYRPLSGYAYN